MSQTLEEVAGHPEELSAQREESAKVYQGREGAILARAGLSPGHRSLSFSLPSGFDTSVLL